VTHRPNEPRSQGDPIRVTDGSVAIDVHVVPRAAKSAVLGTHGGRVKVALAAPPADGKANRELTELFARLAGRPRSAVTLVRGAKSRHKTVAIAGLGPGAAEALRLSLARAVRSAD
jgi:uncharacterized protein (TIGR00251 family)